MRLKIRRIHGLITHTWILNTVLCMSFLTLLTSCGNDTPPIQTYSISGTITAPVNAAVDSDVNDPNYPFKSNNNFYDPQYLDYPVILGGFLSKSGDQYDFYGITLHEGDRVTIYIADPDQANLDLFLYNDNDPINEVDSSQGNSPSETVEAPSDGDFVLDVSAVTGFSNYTLIISPATNWTSFGTLNLTDDFVPGDIVVRFRDHTQSRSMSNKGSLLGMTHKRGMPGKAQLFSVEDDSQVEEAFAALNIPNHARERYPGLSMDKKTQQKLDTLNIIRALRKRPDVIFAEPNYIRRPLAVPDDTYYPFQWHYDLIYLPEAWDIITSSVTSEVIVAVIDTGVLMGHPDLTNRLTDDGYDFISSETNAADGDGIDDDPSDPGDEPGGRSSFHGTHVAGTIAAQTHNTLGVAGVGWDTTKIMPLRVLGVNGGTSYDISQAVLYAAGQDNDSGTTPLQRANIINLSLGGGSFSDQEKYAFTQARQAGCIMIAAAGNSASSNPVYPAALDGVISVSAVDYNSSLSYYSSFGPTIDVAAPGGDTTVDLNMDGYPDGVLSTLGDDSSGIIEDDIYGFYQGTSMASPHMAGVAALMSAVSPAMTPDDLDACLRKGYITIDLGTVGKDIYYGNGLIDAHQAVLVAGEGPVPAVLRVTPSWLGFGSTVESAELLAEKIGDSGVTIEISGVIPNADWLSVTANGDVGNDGLGTYTVTANRNLVSGVSGPGSYSSSITFSWNDGMNTAEVPIGIQVKEGVDESADAGYHYVLLVNTDTGLAYQDFVGVVNGTYSYSFSNVVPGDYYIIAGTDFDNDYWLGDAGEAFGAYLSLDQPIVFTVNGNRSDLDFYTELNINIPDTLVGVVTADSPLIYQMQKKLIER